MKKLFSSLVPNTRCVLNCIIITCCLITSFSAFAQVDVLMNHNNFKRTGWNGNETILTQSSISNGNFGLVFARDVDDQIYAQPLVVSNVFIGGGIHNIVIVATVNNTLYAFDADNAANTIPFWQENLTYDPANYRPIKNTDMTNACGGNYKDFSGNMGIVGTPAIDKITNTLYVVSRSVTSSGPKIFVQYLHAIDILTGAEKPGSPVYITATYPGTGSGSSGGVMTFNQQKQNQRPGLLLNNGIVYIAWASHCDWTPYQGWIIAYDAATLQQKFVYNTVPNGGLAGIWMSGQPPAVDDDGNLYITTGNGTTGSGGNPNDTTNRGESLIKLSPQLKVIDFFTPMNYTYLNNNDLDYGVDGVLLVPNTNFSLSGSKEGRLFMIDNTLMGGTTVDNSNVLQTLNVSLSSTTNTRHLHGTPVYFKNAYGDEYIYAWSEGSLLKQFPFIRSNMRFDTINQKMGKTALPGGMPGAMLSLSSNGNTDGTGILWANHPINGDANQAVVPGVLQAFSADDVTHELWNSNWNSKRDSIGKFAKFVPPTIANGKVYMATFSKKLNVYGLNPLSASSCGTPLPPQWQSADIGYVAYPGDVCVQNGVYTVTASGADIWNTADAFHFVYQPVLTYNMEISARVVSIDNTDVNAKVGVMFRQSLDPGSPYVFLFLTPNNIYFQKRTDQSINASTVKGPVTGTVPYWVKISTTGNKYVSYISSDGSNWSAVDSVTISFGPNPYVGIAYTTHNNSILGTAVVDNVVLKSASPLSVNLIRFTGKNVNEKYAQLDWTTSGEINNNYFEIQRSAANSDFEPIGTVQGNGSASISHQYTFTDKVPMDKVNFYRIKQVDINGNYTYSTVVPVRFNLEKIEIYPNPAHEKFYIKNNARFADSNDVTIKIMDFSGKVLYKQTASSGTDIITVNLPKRIISGMYVVMISNSKGEQQGDKIYITRK